MINSTDNSLKKIAIHQPYFLPYVGYFQLITAAQTFVCLDDVNYIKQGWINRNYIQINSAPYLLTLPVIKASQNRLISEHYFNLDANFIKKNLLTIQNAYSHAPYFAEVYEVYKKIIKFPDMHLPHFLKHSLECILTYLGLKKTLNLASQIEYDRESKKGDRLIEITKTLKFANYINSIGGINIYTKEQFLAQGINLSFLKPDLKPYQQFNKQFLSGLSILDALMFLGGEGVKNAILHDYQIL